MLSFNLLHRPMLPGNPASLTLLGLASAFTLAMVILAALILIPSLLLERAKPVEAVQAIFAVVLQAIGVTLMSLSALTAILTVSTVIAVPQFYYLSLLLVFSVGGFLFLFEDEKLRTLDPAARAIPMLLLHFIFKLTGIVTALLGGYALLSLFLLRQDTFPPSGWVNPFVLGVYGLLLAWSARTRKARKAAHISAPPHTKKGARKNERRRDSRIQGRFQGNKI